MAEERKLKYRIVYSAIETATDKGKAHGWRDRTIINQPCSWCKTPENAKKIFKKGIDRINQVGCVIFTVTEYHIEAIQA